MKTITGIAAGDPQFSILVGALGFIEANTTPALDLAAVLSGASAAPDGKFTVFAPTNAAFGALAADLGFAGDPGDAAAVASFVTSYVSVDTLFKIITYHVSAGAQTAAEIIETGSVATLQGGIIGSTEIPVLNDLEPNLLDPSLLATDLPASNGIIHVIDRVLIPELEEGELPIPETVSITQTVLDISGAEGVDENPGDFDLLRDSLVFVDASIPGSDLVGTLAGEGDFTVFAPTDDAFVKLAENLVVGHFEIAFLRGL